MLNSNHTMALAIASALLTSPVLAQNLDAGVSVGGLGSSGEASASVGGGGGEVASVGTSAIILGGGSGQIASVGETGSIGVGGVGVANETVNASVGSGAAATATEVTIGTGTTSTTSQAAVAKAPKKARSGSVAKKLVTLAASDLVGMEVLARGKKPIGVVKDVNSFNKRYVDVTIALDSVLFDELGEIRMKLPMSNVTSNGIRLNTSVRKIRASL